MSTWVVDTPLLLSPHTYLPTDQILPSLARVSTLPSVPTLDVAQYIHLGQYTTIHQPLTVKSGLDSHYKGTKETDLLAHATLVDDKGNSTHPDLAKAAEAFLER